LREIIDLKVPLRLLLGGIAVVIGLVVLGLLLQPVRHLLPLSTPILLVMAVALGWIAILARIRDEAGPATPETSRATPQVDQASGDVGQASGERNHTTPATGTATPDTDRSMPDLDSTPDNEGAPDDARHT
jgi:cytoskeletal protein RodZ